MGVEIRYLTVKKEAEELEETWGREDLRQGNLRCNQCAAALRRDPPKGQPLPVVETFSSNRPRGMQEEWSRQRPVTFLPWDSGGEFWQASHSHTTYTIHLRYGYSLPSAMSDPRGASV